MRKSFKILALLVVMFFCSVFVGSVNASVGEYQKCTTNVDCVVGEFLYDDNYLPIIDADCTLTSRLPDGNIFINSGTMPPSADGWYSYSIGTSGQTTGLYRSQMCCTSGEDYLCLDKSFTISPDTAESVWNYDNRTISSFGNVVNEIWSYNDRSLSDFGSLVTDIWGHSSKSLSTNTLDGGGEIATGASVENIGTSISALSYDIVNIGTSLASIESKIDSLDTKVNTVNSSLNTLLAKWGSYSIGDIISLVDEVETALGTPSDTCLVGDSIYSNIQCVIDKWGSVVAQDIYTAASSSFTTITSLRNELAYNGKSTTAYQDIQSLINYTTGLQSSLGNPSDSSSTSSLFGRVKQVKEAVDSIDSANLDLTELLNKWGTLSASDIYDKVKNLSSEISAINTISNISSVIDSDITSNSSVVQIKNQVLAMRAILEVNRLQLEKISNQPIIKTWLEEGSIIFKTLVNNPSTITKQNVPLKYYLPVEIKKEDIIKIDGDLDVEYDPTQGALYVSADFSLDPKETKIVSVEVNDIWYITDEQINSIRKQVQELSGPLEKTSYFAQGSTLKTDIEASIDRIISLQKNAITPEAKIKAFREAKIEMDAITKRIDNLKTIVTQAGSTGTLFGFIGGVQAISVWGLIIVLVAGFVFLALYMRTVTGHGLKLQPAPPNPSPSNSPPPTKINYESGKNKKIIFPIALILSASATMAATYVAVNNFRPATRPAGTVLSAKTLLPSPTVVAKVEEVIVPPIENTPTPIPLPTEIIDQKIPLTPTLVSSSPTPTVVKAPVGGSPLSTNKDIMAINPLSERVNVRFSPSTESRVIGLFLANDEVEVLQSKTNDLGEKWYLISLGEKGSGWILSTYLVKKDNSSTTAVSGDTKTPMATITVPVHDAVYVYAFPSFSSKIIGKIEQTQNVELLTETLRWSKAIFPRLNLEGWVSQEFIQRNRQ